MPRVTIPEQYSADPLAYVWGKLAPEIGAAASAYSIAVYERSQLSLREMEAARMRTALINGCQLCIAMRGATDLAGYVKGAGGDVSYLKRRDTTAPDESFYAEVANWRTSAAFTERERLAIEYAERIGQAPQSMDDDEEFWSRMHAVFSDSEIVDMTLSIGAWMALGRFAHVLALDGVCAVPPAAAA